MYIGILIHPTSFYNLFLMPMSYVHNISKVLLQKIAVIAIVPPFYTYFSLIVIIIFFIVHKQRLFIIIFNNILRKINLQENKSKSRK